MKALCLAVAGALTLAGCAQPGFGPTDAATMPRTAAGAPELTQDQAIGLAGWALGDPAKTPPAIRSAQHGHLRRRTGWPGRPALQRLRWLRAWRGTLLGAAPRAGAAALGVAPNAPSQQVVDRLLAAADALAASNTGAAKAQLASPVFTLGADGDAGDAGPPAQLLRPGNRRSPSLAASESPAAAGRDVSGSSVGLISAGERQRRGRRGGPQSFEQPPALDRRLAHRLFFYMAVAADALRQFQQRRGRRERRRAEALQHLLDVRLVFGDQRPFGAPLLGAAERVEPRAAQPLATAPTRGTPSSSTGRTPVCAAPPLGSRRPTAAARGGTAAARRLSNCAASAVRKRFPRVEPRDLVLVLVGQQLGIVARHRLGERRGAGEHAASPPPRTRSTSLR